VAKERDRGVCVVRRQEIVSLEVNGGDVDEAKREVCLGQMTQLRKVRATVQYCTVTEGLRNLRNVAMRQGVVTAHSLWCWTLRRSRGRELCNEDAKSVRCEFKGWSKFRDEFAIPKGKRRCEGERERERERGSAARQARGHRTVKRNHIQ
jgi:hypothetical protein